MSCTHYTTSGMSTTRRPHALHVVLGYGLKHYVLRTSVVVDVV